MMIIPRRWIMEDLETTVSQATVRQKRKNVPWTLAERMLFIVLLKAIVAFCAGTNFTGDIWTESRQKDAFTL